jgi:hypothetical protein
MRIGFISFYLLGESGLRRFCLTLHASSAGPDRACEMVTGQGPLWQNLPSINNQAAYLV